MFTALQLVGLFLIAACLVIALGVALGMGGYIAGALGGAGVAVLYVGVAGER